ncbi:MAG: glutathione S-transferase family protein [Gammaproteobacteria bacterium]|nr:glutathione S-transferase family protein [Gammaproteobacteria bacterium]
MSSVILHHYPQSPVSEKVRVVLGIKQLDWRSVEIPRLPPKPALMPLTGGYRRTPVMQIGADVYCDSQCIIRELERRFPEPTLYPGGGAGMVWGVSRWTDGPLFTLAVSLVFGAQADELPQEFADDRGRLYFGPDYDLQAMKRQLPQILTQLRAQLGWIEQRLVTGRTFILGNEPSLPDALCYHLVWFIRGRYAGGPEFLSQFPNLVAWEKRVSDIGHGQPSDMTADEALAIAKAATSETETRADPGDPEGLAPGLSVAVVPSGIGSDPAVTGEIVSLSADEIAIRRSHDRVGDVIVHFPRVGYQVSLTSA